MAVVTDRVLTRSINYFALFLLGGEFVVLDECGDILDIVKEEIKQEPKDNMNPVVRLHKLPSNWTELKEAELQNNYHHSNSNLPSTVSPVSTVWRSQEFRDRFGMIQSRNIGSQLGCLLEIYFLNKFWLPDDNPVNAD